MSTSSVVTTLPDRAFSRPLTPFQAVISKAWNPDADLEPVWNFRDLSGALLLLPSVAMATLRYAAPPAERMEPTTTGDVTEASLRLAWHKGWKDGKRSGWEVATGLEHAYAPTGITGIRSNGDLVRRIPRKGLGFIAATDQLGYVQWWCDMPRPENPYTFETVRLKDALTKGDQRRRRQIE